MLLSTRRHFRLPFAESESSTANTSTGGFGGSSTLAPSPFQKLNILSGSLNSSPFQKKPVLESSPKPVNTAEFESDLPTQEFEINTIDFAQELLAETKRKHPKAYISVLTMKIPATIELLKAAQVDEQKIQKLVTEFSIPPANHPHSSKFGTAEAAEASAASYFKGGASPKPPPATTPLGAVPVDDSAFSPFEKPNVNPQKATPVKTQAPSKPSSPLSPFQPPNTSIPEYYSKYFTTSSPQAPSQGANVKLDIIPPGGASPTNKSDAPTFSLFAQNLTDARQQMSFSTDASFMATSQSAGSKSIRNLAASSLASTYSGNVESVEGGEQPRGQTDVFVTNTNVDFNPYTSGTIVKCKERLTEIDDAALAKKDNGKGIFERRSLRAPDSPVDVAKLRLLGDETEQNRLKDLVITESDWNGSNPHHSQYASERAPCFECGKVFADVNALSIHRQTHHPHNKIDLFEELRKNHGSMKQLLWNRPRALENTDVAEYCQPRGPEADSFYTRPFPWKPIQLSPEQVAGYVAERQILLSQSETDRTEIDEKKPDVALSGQLVNTIILNGLLEFIGEENIHGERYLQLYLNAEGSERFPVRYYLGKEKMSTPSSKRTLRMKGTKKTATAPTKKTKKVSDSNSPFDIPNVSGDDVTFLSTLKRALGNTSNSRQCVVIGELKISNLIHGPTNLIHKYAFVRLHSSAGKVVFQ